MGKKKSQDWPEAKKLCRLNQNDIAMAKRLGFAPHSLIRNRPDPKQKWKLPVREWIHELHFKRFGYVQGEKPVVAPPPPPASPEEEREEARRFEEQLYWEDYAARNEDSGPGGSWRHEPSGEEVHEEPAEMIEGVQIGLIEDEDVLF